MIKTWHICISGFTQSLRRETGFDRLWKQLRKVASEEVSTPLPIAWNKIKASGIADMIFRSAQNGREVISPRICVYAYSWGCGHGFLKLASELRKRGADRFKIANVVLCDPIYHHWFRPLAAMTTGRWAERFAKIKIPDNVWHVDSFFQRQNRPQGFKLVKKNPDSIYPILNSSTQLKYNHAYMDNAPEFHEKCLTIAKQN